MQVLKVKENKPKLTNFLSNGIFFGFLSSKISILFQEKKEETLLEETP